MPNRYLRASYIDSKRINSLTAEGERMFCRLLVHVDDWGRCEADPDLLLGKLFARQLKIVRVDHIAKWLRELQVVDLIAVYQVDGQAYLEMRRFERGRAQRSRYPDPDEAQPIQITTTEARQDPQTPREPDRFEELWAAYPKKVGKADALRCWARLKPRPQFEDVMKALDTQKASEQWRLENGRFIPNPATWINQGRWMDEGTVIESKNVGSFES
jgi:hypothetical protein